jgi:hypothetical protein
LLVDFPNLESLRLAIDLVRPLVSGSSDISYWFQQNIILYTEPEIAAEMHSAHNPPHASTLPTASF